MNGSHSQDLSAPVLICLLEELSSADAEPPACAAALQYHSGMKILLPKDGVLLLRTPS